jgi:hypothetical protein
MLERTDRGTGGGLNNVTTISTDQTLAFGSKKSLGLCICLEDLLCLGIHHDGAVKAILEQRLNQGMVQSVVRVALWDSYIHGCEVLLI